jgi:cobaltochelatase CobN
VDVTFRVSGLFRDAFPTRWTCIGSAARAVMPLDEPDEANPIAANVRARAARCSKPDGMACELCAAAGDASRVRLQARRLWRGPAGADGRGRLEQSRRSADVYLDWGGYAYGSGREGEMRAREFSPSG